MVEEQVAFLYKLSTSIGDKSTTSGSQSFELIKSYYLMRCHQITKSYGLPAKHFSPNLRCSHCCTDWKPKNHIAKVKPLKLSKKQKKECKEKVNNENIVEITCLLCKKNTTLKANKPLLTKMNKNDKNLADTINNKTEPTKKTIEIKQQSKNKQKQINVYYDTNKIFSLSNKNNDIDSWKNKVPNVIKNNKKKKDKFAGLCKEAVLSAAKINKAKEDKNKLNLFLKPSK